MYRLLFPYLFISSFSITPSLLITSAPTPPWEYNGFTKFPALFFGANSSGLHNDAALQFISKHSMIGLGWQQGTNITLFQHLETQLSQGILQIYEYLLMNNNTIPLPSFFVYRHFQMSWTYFDITRAAATNPLYYDMFIHDNDDLPGSVMCRQPASESPNSTAVASPLFLFHNSTAGDYWVNEVVQEVSTEFGSSAVFFDECDWNIGVTGAYNFKRDGCYNLSDSFLVQDMRDKYDVMRRTSNLLVTGSSTSNEENTANKVNEKTKTFISKWPIFSFQNYFNASFTGLTPNITRPSMIPFEEVVQNLSSVSWMRFDEFWLSTHNKDYDAADLVTMQMLVRDYNVPVVLRAQGFSNNTCTYTDDDNSSSTDTTATITNPPSGTILKGYSSRISTTDVASFSPITTLSGKTISSSSSSSSSSPITGQPVDLVYALAGFLIIQENYTYFGYSSGWYTVNWCWESPYYDYQYGTPLNNGAPATRVSTYVWYRNFTNVDVTIDTEKGEGIIVFK